MAEAFKHLIGPAVVKQVAHHPHRVSPTFQAQRGMAHPERALLALHAITQRFTAEFAIRPFIVQHPELVFRTLNGWVNDPCAHVRRLVSEGSRPRLPWGLRLQALVKDPSPTLPMLHALQDNPSEYVRRSVANHLNDIAKDHPELISHWLAEHLPEAPLSRQRLLRHASRSLIKTGHPGVMQAWGLGQGLVGTAHLSASTHSVRIGEKVTLYIELTAPNGHATDQRLEVDYLVHHIKANGGTSPKAFKGKRVVLPSQGSVSWDKAHSFVPVSTRRYFPGEHRIELQVNGRVVNDTMVRLLA